MTGLYIVLYSFCIGLTALLLHLHQSSDTNFEVRRWTGLEMVFRSVASALVSTPPHAAAQLPSALKAQLT